MQSPNADPTEAAPPRLFGDRADQLVVGLLAAALVAGVAIFFHVIAVAFVRQPFSDTLGYIQEEFDFERQRRLIHYLWLPHNRQHLVWFRVLTTLDVRLFHGTSVIFAVAAATAVIGAAGLLMAELWRAIPVKAVAAGAALLVGLVLVNAINADGVVQPVNATYPIAIGFIVIAVMLFERRDTASPRRAIAFVGLAFLAAAGAAMGCGAGVAIWPALVVSAWRGPSRLRWTAAAFLAGAAITLALLDVSPGGAAASSPFGFAHLWKMTRYLVLYAGMPWSVVKTPWPIRYLFGLINLSLGAALLWRGARRTGAEGRIERIGLDLVGFALVTAVLAAIGRVDENAEVLIPARYAVFMSVFLAGLVCVAAPWLAPRWAAVRRAAAPLALAAGCVLLAMSAVAGAGLINAGALIRERLTAFDQGARTPELRRLIFPDLESAASIYREMRRRGLYR